MKTLSFVALAAVAALALGQSAQKEFVATDRAKNFEVRGQSVAGFLMDGRVTKATVKGSVSVKSQSQGLGLTANQVDLEFGSIAGKPAANELKSATATGNVILTKTANNRNTIIKGTRCDFIHGSTDSTIKMAGPVQLTDNNARNQQAILATGNTLTASLIPNNSGTRGGLRTTTLEGSVRVLVTQAPAAGQPADRLTATAARMVLNNTANPATVTLTGNVNIDGDSFGTLQNMNRVVLALNEEGQVTRVEGGQ
jgi:hypothetical protein